MKIDNKKGRTAVRMRRGFASAVLLATLATQAMPILQVSAETLDYNYGSETPYKTDKTAQYVIDINPMIGAGQVGAGATKASFAPQGGTYSVQRVARYTLTGERIVVSETAQTVTLTPDNNNQIKVKGDGEYKITPVNRIPGFLKDLGATTEVDAVDGEKAVEAQGHYVYAFPLIDNGVPSGAQGVDFQPKLREARTDLAITKVGDDGAEPLAGITFAVYKTHDAQLNKDYADGTNKIGQATTGETGVVNFENLIEGEYYFVEEGSVPDRYLPDTRHVEFSVTVGDDGEKVTLASTDASDVATDGNNIRGDYEWSGSIKRNNYIDPAQNKDQTFQQVKGNYSEVINTTKGEATGNNEGVVYVNTNGSLEYSASVDIPKNFNDYEDFSVVDTINEKLTLDESSVELRVVGSGGLEETYSVGDLGADFAIDGQKITMNAKGASLSPILEADGVDYTVLTYKANVDTNEILENVEFETLTNTQTITADTSMTDANNPSGTTVHSTDILVREGRIEIDKDASDAEKTPLAGADFQLYRPVTDGETATITNDKIGWVKASNPRTGANYSGTTDVNGSLEYNNLPYGEYLVVETKAPDGYRLNNSPTRVTLTEENSSVEFDGTDNTVVTNIVNMRRNQIFPGTGTTGNVLTLAVLAVAGATLVGVSIKKRKDKTVTTEDTTQG